MQTSRLLMNSIRGDRLGVVEGHIGLDAIAHFIGERLVGAEFRPHQRRAGIQRGARSGGCVLPVIVDLDQFGGILRERAAVRHDERDGVPDIVHAIAAEDGNVARRRARAVRLLLHHPRLERSEVGDILALSEPDAHRAPFGRHRPIRWRSLPSQSAIAAR